MQVSRAVIGGVLALVTAMLAYEMAAATGSFGNGVGDTARAVFATIQTEKCDDHCSDQ